ncbi:MAG TPA: hypothetical protein VHX36_09985 [Candidatus Acidoferrales bacterium]|jgi:hypothetical protein|nr:hypothetical protein [Candidatus Acidoferrales bacterium]
MLRATVLDPSVSQTENRWLPTSQTEREAVQEQLERILAHPSFKHSKRYPNLLRYVVEHTLSGEGHLKERTLGVEVFARDPGYDTNEDPVVRITAGEIRKRIAQYYHEPGREAELRIDLPPGSYVPEFHLPVERSSVDLARAVPASILESKPPRSLAASSARRWVYALLAIVLVVVFVRIAWVRSLASEGALGDFWNSSLQSPGPMLVCIGEPGLPPSAAQPNAAGTVLDHIYYGSDRVKLADANALFHLAEFLGSKGKPSHLQAATATSLTDLRQGPVVLVAGIDNPWTTRIAQPLQFHFGFAPGQNVAWIEDRANPSRHDWLVNFAEQYSQLTQDYAIVARFSDPITGQPVIIAAGLGENGTVAAGEFLTSERDMEDAAKQAPGDWRHKNAEIVIATQVIDGKSGPPRVLATYFW